MQEVSLNINGAIVRIVLIGAPSEERWMEVKQRAFVTQVELGKTGAKLDDGTMTPPTSEWKYRILKARHSPIRHLEYSFLLEGLPSWISVHLVRHVHAQPYVKSQRNDRQNKYDRTKAPQDAPVDMIWDINGEELMVIANKRLCGQASQETRMVVKAMCALAEQHTPELEGLLVPMCVYQNGCNEMRPCGFWTRRNL